MKKWDNDFIGSLRIDHWRNLGASVTSRLPKTIIMSITTTATTTKRGTGIKTTKGTVVTRDGNGSGKKNHDPGLSLHTAAGICL